MNRIKRFTRLALTVLLCGCAGISKSCSQFGASVNGADWIVAQYAQDGHVFHCWKLHGASVESEEGGGVNWKDPRDGHLVHLTGWENRVQVQNGDYAGAARIIGVNASQCENGVYPSTPTEHPNG